MQSSGLINPVSYLMNDSKNCAAIVVYTYIYIYFHSGGPGEPTQSSGKVKVGISDNLRLYLQVSILVDG